MTRHRVAVVWIVLSAAAFALTAAAIRQATQELHPFQAVFLRCLLGAAFIFPWLAKRGLARVRTKHLKLYIVRAVFEFLNVALLFLALSKLPLAQAATLSFTLPLFGALGAAVFLRESIGRHRWNAVILGFTGVLIMLRPGFEAVSPYAVIALLSAAFAAASTLVVKRLVLGDDADIIVFYMAVLVAPLALMPALTVWRPFSLHALFWVGAVSAIGTVAHLALARSLAFADASVIMPWKYIQLVFAVLIGYFAYGEIVDQWTWLGAAIIVSSAVWATRRVDHGAIRKVLPVDPRGASAAASGS